MRSPLLRGRLPAGSGLLLIPAASLVVHQLRYTLAYGSRANAELAAQGHSYLYSLTPWFVFALGIGLALFLRRAAHALRTGDAGVFSRLSSLAVWLLAWAGLVAIYAMQELLEELLASGHPGRFRRRVRARRLLGRPGRRSRRRCRHPLPARRARGAARRGRGTGAPLAAFALRRRSRRPFARSLRLRSPAPTRAVRLRSRRLSSVVEAAGLRGREHGARARVPAGASRGHRARARPDNDS